jgi:hypothetical protein
VDVAGVRAEAPSFLQPHPRMVSASAPSAHLLIWRRSKSYALTSAAAAYERPSHGATIGGPARQSQIGGGVASVRPLPPGRNGRRTLSPDSNGNSVMPHLGSAPTGECVLLSDRKMRKRLTSCLCTAPLPAAHVRQQTVAGIQPLVTPVSRATEVQTLQAQVNALHLPEYSTLSTLEIPLPS